METRWNAKLRLVTELEEEYRREQRRGLTPLTEAEHALLRALVTDLPTLWSAPATTAEERKRLVRCLVREVILDRGAGANGAGGITTLRIGWKSGAWTELRVRRPSTADYARTPAAVLERIRASAAQLPDERIAEQLNADGVTTRQGLRWTAARVERIRRYHQIPTGCPTMPTVLPSAGQPRGDGLVSVGVAAARLGVAPSAFSHWRKWGFLHAEQRGPGAPLRVRSRPRTSPGSTGRWRPRATVGGGSTRPAACWASPKSSSGTKPGRARSSPTAPASPTTGSGGSVLLTPTPP